MKKNAVVEKLTDAVVKKVFSRLSGSHGASLTSEVRATLRETLESYAEQGWGSVLNGCWVGALPALDSITPKEGWVLA